MLRNQKCLADSTAFLHAEEEDISFLFVSFISDLFVTCGQSQVKVSAWEYLLFIIQT